VALENQDGTHEQGSQTGRKATVAAIVAGAALAGSVAYSVWNGHQLQADLNSLRASMDTQVSEMRQVSAGALAAQQKTLDSLRQSVLDVQQTSAVAVGEAKREAHRKAEALLKQLDAAQRKQHELMTSELSQVKQAATATDEKVSSVMNQVETVNTDLGRTRSDLEKITGDLKTVTGDLGVQSGLIATNSRELAALRELGERNYIEFDLRKTKTPVKIGNVLLQLKKADVKRSKYELVVIADDRRVEKKDKYINEPVQFYVGGMRQPYEIVVNQVNKDRVVGYLAAPKVTQARR
jgi:chromosome segregation ATPase